MCIMFSFEQSEALIQDMAGERVSLRGRLREKRGEQRESAGHSLRKQRQILKHIANLSQREKWIAGKRKNAEQEGKQEYFPFSLLYTTGLKRETLLLSQTTWTSSGICH